MIEPVIRNARIRSTELGLIANGMMSCFLHLEWPGGGVGFGGTRMDTWDKTIDDSVGTQYGCDLIIHILKVVGVEKWEDLPGKHVRLEDRGLGRTVRKIGHLLEDKWFDIEEFSEEWRRRTP